MIDTFAGMFVPATYLANVPAAFMVHGWRAKKDPRPQEVTPPI